MEKQIKGTVQQVPFPKKGYFFTDFEYSIFKFSTDDGHVITCKGETFPIYNGQRLKITGEDKKQREEHFFHIQGVEKDFNTSNSIHYFLREIAGKVTAENLKEYFGSDEKVFDVIKNEPERLTDVSGVGEKKKIKIIEKWQKNFRIEEVFRAFKDYGLTMKESSKLVKKYGDKTVEKIKANPYRLSYQLLTFQRADEIAFQLGKEHLDSHQRNLAAMIEVLKNNQVEGNTYMKKRQFFLALRKILGRFDRNYVPSDDKLRESFEIFLNKKIGVIVEDKYIYYKKYYNDEQDVRKFIEGSLNNHYESVVTEKDIDRYEKQQQEIIEGFSFGDEQREAILRSSKNRISVITGGPGTGKTTILDALIKVSKLEESQIALCSPTGKAARRMTEATGMRAKTIHSLLEVDPTEENLTSFKYNKDNKLPHKMIVIDEASMIDQSIAASLLRAIDINAKIVFVGDIEQLPPVGSGYFLRDLIESIGEEGRDYFAGDHKVTRLIKTYRQAEESSIIRLSQKIRDNDISFQDVAEQRKDYAFIPYKGNSEQIVNLFNRAVEKAGIDEAIILTPQNKTEIGVKELNLKILDTQIPFDKTKSQIKRNGWVFREGAKIMMTKNVNKLGLVNGQIGYIKKIDMQDKKIVVDFEGEIQIFEGDMIDNLSLAYALTVHKSQGSEWKYVIEVVSSKHRNNTKSLIYTGITRAKKALILIGDIQTIIDAPKKQEEEPLSRILNPYR